MATIRLQLRQGLVWAIALALLSTWPLEIVLEMAAQYLARWFATGWNHFISGPFSPKFNLPFKASLPWRFVALQLGASVAAALVLWLIALSLYPETDLQPSEQ